MGRRAGVGSFTVQLAKGFGADVTGVCHAAEIDLVGSIGADDVIVRPANRMFHGVVAERTVNRATGLAGG